MNDWTPIEEMISINEMDGGIQWDYAALRLVLWFRMAPEIQYKQSSIWTWWTRKKGGKHAENHACCQPSHVSRRRPARAATTTSRQSSGCWGWLAKGLAWPPRSWRPTAWTWRQPERRCRFLSPIYQFPAFVVEEQTQVEDVPYFKAFSLKNISAFFSGFLRDID